MPQMQLSTLVLPAPLGPIRHRSSASRVANDTPCKTSRPPNARPTSRSSRWGPSAIPAPAPPVLLDVAVAALPLAAEAQVELADVRVLPEFIGGAGKDDPAVLEHVRVIGDIECNRGVLLNEQDRHPEIASNLLQEPDELLDDQRRQPLGQLVDQQQTRRAGQRGADRKHLPLTSREQPGVPRAQLRERWEVLPYRVGEAARIGPAPRDNRFQVLGHRQVLEHLAPLGDERAA